MSVLARMRPCKKTRFNKKPLKRKSAGEANDEYITLSDCTMGIMPDGLQKQRWMFEHKHIYPPFRLAQLTFDL